MSATPNGRAAHFVRAPELDNDLRTILEAYLGKPINRGRYKDALLLETLDYGARVAKPNRPATYRKRGEDQPEISN